MSEQKLKLIRQKRRKKRVSFKIIGTSTRPRISVYRSSKHLFIQVIDDGLHKTISHGTDRGGLDGTKTEKAALVGRQLAENLKQLKITSVVFDRGRNRYLGRVRALAEAIRDSGITI
ncbi:50S ribosomal protein L18 [Candidatus Roizmanbacteria bacterium RIFCSPHIGHO2_01_FULL_39_12b]|uniref:Large ribosomal subunit protein uL18 n=1 Tax=Candidatus Roizmanbacteria bacterium RIFCSPHIGHO2_01_FULL_39_12b TaxID=1802030 RepID=A0A1F7GBY6_9BACT|nr:MAG: 50S ribosomal protein L18 [Candidatus Roizmanbacteria bacterium RIFCSPHIGHO2_01_FULL_39_12b]OGK47091.1 MAG: 50S ribosomal protein L18 [Candidatus Roizmanbacteria bacterium RIFCSPLOWO2_01_FULL_39_19]